MKKTLALILTLLLVLPAYAGAEATVEPAVEQTAARGDGYTIAYDATAFSFYLDGVSDGCDLLVPTQDAPSPVYMLISRLESVEAEKDSFTQEGYADAGETVLASGLSAHMYTLERSGVDYVCYIVEDGTAAFSMLTVCSQQAGDYAQPLRAVVDTFAFASETAQADA